MYHALKGANTPMRYKPRKLPTVIAGASEETFSGSTLYWLINIGTKLKRIRNDRLYGGSESTIKIALRVERQTPSIILSIVLT